MRAMRRREGMLLLSIAGVLATGCVGGGESEPVEQAAQMTRAPDGSLRRPFLGGAFVTWNEEMPIEIDQAIAGEIPDHPVVVWAGD
jgi:hypothetical protein